jgi:alkylated DNA repair dioxygenase AlkB
MKSEPVTYIPGWIKPPAGAQQLFESLRDDLPWLRVRRRSEYWTNTFDRPYTYGRGKGELTYDAQPPHHIVDVVREAIAIETGVPALEGCFLNYYLDGSDALGMHADDDPGIDHTRPIAVVTLGHGRLLRYKEQAPGSHPVDIFLEPGSLLLMHAGMQSTHFHSIPAIKDDPASVGPRISLTYRGLLDEAAYQQMMQERALA